MTADVRRRVRPIVVVAAFVVGLLLTTDVLNAAVYLPWALVGAVLTIRRPGNVLGPLLMVFANTWTFTTEPFWIPLDDLRAGRYDLLTGIRLVASEGAGFLSYATLFVLAVLFPDGALPPGRWRWIVIAVFATGVIAAIGSSLAPSIVLDYDDGSTALVPNPIGFAPIGVVFQQLNREGLTFLVLVLALAAGVGVMVRRRRRATGARRQQFTWVVAAFAALAIGLIGGLGTLAVGEALRIDVPVIVWLPALIAYPLPPLAIGIAVLRYRLYEIDRLVSRTIGYGLATAGLIASFAALTLALQQVLAPVIQGRVLAVAASTLVVFALFQPIHRRIQRIVDRRFDRARFDMDRAASSFARGVRDETDLERVEAALVRTVDDTLAPRSRHLWVRDRRLAAHTTPSGS